MKGKQGATLADIIRCGDMDNHAIFTLPELRTGLAKLLAAGCIKTASGRWLKVHPMPKVRGNSKIFTDPQLGDPRWSYPLPDKEYREAVDAYLKG